MLFLRTFFAFIFVILILNINQSFSDTKNELNAELPKDKWKWAYNLESVEYILEAARRGLNCGVKNINFNIINDLLKDKSGDRIPTSILSSMTEFHLCLKATTINKTNYLDTINDFHECKKFAHKLDNTHPLRNLMNINIYKFGFKNEKVSYKKDYNKARHNMFMAACKGLHAGIKTLAEEYYKGLLLEKNHKKSLVLFLYLNYQGHNVAREIAKIYLDNKQIKKDCNIAAKWIIKAEIQWNWNETPFRDCPQDIKIDVERKISNKPVYKYGAYFDTDVSKSMQAGWKFFRNGDIQNSIFEFRKASSLGNKYAKNYLKFLNINNKLKMKPSCAPLGQLLPAPKTANKLEYGGLVVENYTKKLKEKYNIKLNFGFSVVITSVKKDSSAYNAGLKEGMSILGAGSTILNMRSPKEICSFYHIVEYQRKKTSYLVLSVRINNGNNDNKFFRMENLRNEVVNFPNTNNQDIFISNKKIKYAELEKEKQKRIALERKADKEEKKRKALEKEIAELKKKNKELNQSKKQTKAKPKSSSGSGFFISKLGHIITNQHVVNKCKKITIGDHIDKQVPAQLLETDRENDLALLRTTNIKMASAETQSLIRKLSIEIVPLASGGLMRKSDVKGGEDVIVAGFPYGVMFSKTIKVTKGIVSSTRGVGDDSGQFQIDAAVQPGNSGGPIYDRYGNIVGVVVAQLNKFKMAKSIGSLPENVNFGIKASTVSQFLNTSGVITNWAKRTNPVSNEKLFDIASKQTVMVVCHRD